MKSIILILLFSVFLYSHNVCLELSKNPAEFIKLYADKKGFKRFDIDNDGIPNKIKCEWGGTAHIGICNYISKNNEEISFGGEDDNGRIWGDIYFIKYDNKSYILNANSSKEPLFLSFNNNKICNFKTETIGKLIPNPDIKFSNNICNSIQNKRLSAINYINFDKEPLDRDLASYQWFWESPQKSAFLDYNNDGIVDNVLEVSYASGAGRGCDTNYFLDLKNNKNNLLKKLKKEIDCGATKNKFFTHKNLNYFEYKNEHYDKSRNTHKVFLIKDSKIYTVCDYKKELKITVEENE